MNILEQILEHKKKEVEGLRKDRPILALEQSLDFSKSPLSLRKSLLEKDATGIIAEIKRKSPSRGIIHGNASVEKISTGYIKAGATALSILTDHQFFGGDNGDLVTARRFNTCPILRKDFIIDEYQVVESRSIGAYVILLIAAALPPKKLKSLC